MKKTQDMVHEILKGSKESRNSDMELYTNVCGHINPMVLEMPFGFVMSHLKDFGLPPFETVRRTRQKLQAEYKELRANDKVEGYRMLNEIKFKEYAKENI